MGININDLDSGSSPIGASLLSGNETILDNLRELSDDELKTSGGGKDSDSDSVYIDNGYSGYFYSGGSGGKKGGGGPTVISNGGYGGGYGRYPGYGLGYGGDININVDANANSNSRSNSYSH
jgi:hypothetical protein